MKISMLFRAMLLVCIPLMTIIGTILASSSGSNSILLFLIILISVIILCSSSKRLVPTETLPLVVFLISFFLLFHLSLISKYLIGYDVNLEFYFAKLTSISSIWDRTIPHEYNAMLSIGILPSIYSTVLDLDLNWIFKAVYPLIFSFVPLTLYLAYSKQTDSQVAFLSVFFLMSMDMFYNEMLGLARQMIAEFFFALLILLMVEDNIGLFKKRLLFVIFSGGLIVSHYAISYIFMFYTLFTFFLMPLLKHSDIQHRKVINGGFVFLYLAMTFSWYLFVTVAPAKPVISVFVNIYDRLQEFSSGPGISGLMPTFISPIHEASKYLFYILQFNIVIGLARLIGGYKKTRFSPEYLSMSLASMCVLMMCIFIPTFAASLNMTRFYHITLFFLAPFSVLGGLTIVDLLTSLKSRSFTYIRKLSAKSGKSALFLVSLLIVSSFLFRVGFVYEVTGDIPSSLSLSLNRMRTNPFVAVDIWSAYIPEQDVFSATWLSAHASDESKVYADRLSRLYVLTSYGMIPMAYVRNEEQSQNGKTTYDFMLRNKGNQIYKGYVYLRQLNVVYGKMADIDQSKYWSTASIYIFLDSLDKIYSNGDSDIYSRP